jgi:ribosome modulation factor
VKKQLMLLNRTHGTRNKTIAHMSADEFGEHLNIECGAKDYVSGRKRQSNPFTLPRTRFLWEQGWKEARRLRINAKQRARYHEQKRQSVNENDKSNEVDKG